jgi:cell division septation protein DedD
MMDEAKLIEKLRLIEALHSGATTAGEREAAARARERILERLAQIEKEDPPLEYRFSMGDMWSRKVFVALLRRYGIRPYRYKRQRHTTVMARVSKRFVDETLWPEFQEISDSLQTYLSEVTDRVVSQVIHQDSSDADVVDDPSQLPASTVPPSAPEPETSATTTTSVQTNTSEAPSSSPDQSSKNRKKRKRKKRKHR